MEDYRSLLKHASSELIIKKSRFIGFAYRIDTEDEAKAIIENLKIEHNKANHHCAAYQIGLHNEIQRAFDDGEPQGTAGLPILEVLKQEDLKNSLLVVVRYFGGIKLGASGLIRAYSQAASAAIDAAGRALRQIQVQLSLTVPYKQAETIAYWLTHSPYQVLSTTYLADVTYQIGVPEGELAILQSQLTNLTSGQASFIIGDKAYVDIPILK